MLFEELADGLIARTTRRDPDEYIGEKADPFVIRWHIARLSKRGIGNVYLHNIVRDDDDRALHDHPWPNVSIVLRTGYMDVVPLYPDMWPHNRETKEIYRAPGSVTFRRGRDPHRIVCLPDDYGGRRCAWSLFITGPNTKPWGFWSPRAGWVHHASYRGQ